MKCACVRCGIVFEPPDNRTAVCVDCYVPLAFYLSSGLVSEDEWRRRYISEARDAP